MPRRRDTQDDLDSIFAPTGHRRPRREADRPGEEAPPPRSVEEIDVKLSKLMTGDLIPKVMWLHCPQCLDEREEHLHGSVLVFGGRVIF